MEGTSKDTSFTWPYEFPDIRDENNSKWTEVEKKLNDPRFQAATARIFGESRPVKPCVRSAFKRRFDLENSQTNKLRQDGSPRKKSRLASIATTSTESEQGSTSPCDSACGCSSQSNGLANEWESLCKRILSIREKLQSVPEMNSSFDQRVRELSDKARCTYDWLQNVIPPSRSHSENSYDLQDVSDYSSNRSPDASSCSEADLNLNNSKRASKKSETCVGDGEQDQTMLKKFVSPTYAKNVENIAVYGKNVLITLKESPQEILSPSLCSTEIYEFSSEKCSNPKSLTVPVSKRPDHIKHYISSKSRMSSPTQNLAQVSLSNRGIENLTDANPKESCLSFRKDLTHYFSFDPVQKSSMNRSASCDNVNEIVSHIKLEEISDQETEKACSGAESPEISDTNSVDSDSSESDDSIESDFQILDTSTHSSDSEEEYSTALSDDEVSDPREEFIATLKNEKCRDNLESVLPKTEPHTDSDTSDSEASRIFNKSSPCSEPPKRTAVPYSGDSSPMPDLTTYIVTSVPVLSLNKSDLMNHGSNSNFRRKRDEYQEVRSRVQLCKRAILLNLKEQLCKEVKVVVPRLPDYIYKAHSQSKPIMLKNILPLISQVKSLTFN